MANGQQRAEENVQTFLTWVASKTDDDFRELVSRGVLSRVEIAKECGFGKSALDQNGRIKTALRELEDELRVRAILPPLLEADPNKPSPALLRETSGFRAAKESERLRRLEQENAALKAEVAELKRVVERYGVLSEALALTGRIPR
ncbi:VPA1267 family protein [Paracidovorax konjaci]|uniref:VPA1267 family protein n=1 Tax=Paracidovorax konjaci TaxID=32040 RepID=UPI000B853D64|nr:VPA1267 family protein [Paracidovorax konjaci]